MRLNAILSLSVSAMIIAGCTGADPTADRVSRARVDAVYLYQHGINVHMSDGQLCTAQKPGGAGLTWSGRLTGCAHPLSFSVALAQRVNPMRMVLDEVGLSPILNPIARVTVTEASGREVIFASPPPE